jgi:hypothetical protein
MDTASSGPSSSYASRRRWWRLPLVLAGTLILILLMRDRWARDDALEPEVTPPAPAGDSAEQVWLTVDFGDGRRERYTAAAWRDGMTVGDLMQDRRRADLQFAVKGSGTAAFLTSIQGVSNEGADGRNWTYTVNGKRGDRSYAVYELRPGDQVLWTFSKQQ